MLRSASTNTNSHALTISSRRLIIFRPPQRALLGLAPRLAPYLWSRLARVLPLRLQVNSSSWCNCGALCSLTPVHVIARIGQAEGYLALGPFVPPAMHLQLYVSRAFDSSQPSSCQPNRHGRQPNRHGRQPNRHGRQPNRHGRQPNRHGRDLAQQLRVLSYMHTNRHLEALDLSYS
jgi:hypothetical protein